MAGKTKAKNPVGRPKSPDSDIEIAFKVPPEIANYLRVIGNKYGWGRSANMVARQLLMARVVEMQLSRFEERTLQIASDETEEDKD
ncbi:hypothetical protein [Hyphococcus luteus]|uniref:hypothetical protein n=1 Tax=Hyphococcus luteus TaxID=2058213 RepID=UPI0010574CC9|nr:hypothetical protein [Marinicaulis flavus]